MRKLVVPVAVLAAAVIGGGTVYAVLGAGTGNADTGGDPDPVRTAVVERGDLAATETWKGTIDYGAAVTLRSPASGIVTRAPETGSPITFGDAAIHVDERPVTVMRGAVPMYRNLGPGDRGVDVEQFERGLAALGYEGFTADDEFTWYTAAAVKRWQRDLDVERTGTVAAEALIFAAEIGRVDRVHVEVGDTVGSGDAVVDLTGETAVVSLEIDVDDLDLAETGAELAVEMAGGGTVMGTVARRNVIEPADGSGEEPPSEEDPVARVEIELAEPVPEERIGSPVTVEVVVDLREDVLLVPVTALLALSEGGFGLELAEDGGTVAVEVGLFADGMVEVSGPEIEEGTVVGAAGR